MLSIIHNKKKVEYIFTCTYKYDYYYLKKKYVIYNLFIVEYS